MKKLLYSLAALCVLLLTACGPSHTEQVDKLAEMYNQLKEIIATEGGASQAAVDKYGEIMNYQTDLAKDFSDFTPEERDYYAKVNLEGMEGVDLSETATAYYARMNGEDFGARPEDKDMLDEAKNMVNDAVDEAAGKAADAVEEAKGKAADAVEEAKAKAADAVKNALN